MDEEFALPSGQGLIAATMALMTAFANPCREARVDVETQRLLMARKIVSNLFVLREHPDTGVGLRGVVASMHRHWAALVRVLECEGPADATMTDDARPSGVLH